jgi:hypothetical protein
MLMNSMVEEPCLSNNSFSKDYNVMPKLIKFIIILLQSIKSCSSDMFVDRTLIYFSMELNNRFVFLVCIDHTPF